MEPNIIGCLQNGAIDLVINIPLPTTVEDEFEKILEDEYKIRRMAVDYNIPVIVNLELAKALIEAIDKTKRKEISIKSLNTALAVSIPPAPFPTNDISPVCWE